jgi:transketolase
MRNAFINAIYDVAREDKNVILLAADIGYGVLDKFFATLPEQVINVGISEANMTGLAAGLALRGKKAFNYTIIPFATLRCLEQIKVDVCMQQLDVKIFGVGGGLAYGPQGPTHHAIEDVGVLRALPQMRVLVPADPIEAGDMARALTQIPGPAYVRLAKSGEPAIPALPRGFTLGQGKLVREGNDVALISAGPILGRTLALCERLEANGRSVRVISIHTIKPLDNELILDTLRHCQEVYTIEEHNIVGGLGTAVAEVLAESGLMPKRFRRFGLQDRYVFGIGDQDYLLDQEGLSIDALYRAIVNG